MPPPSSVRCGTPAATSDSRPRHPPIPTPSGRADHTRAIVEVRGGDGPDPVESVEYFAPILGVVEVGGTGQEFLDAAVAHANDRLTGTLGANVLIDPVTEQALGDGFERAMADLRYGDIAINTWTAFNFLTARLTWGGYPGATPADVSSGIGVVHNALLLDRVERSVARGPFRPVPAVAGRYAAASASGSGHDPADAAVVRELAHRCRGERRAHALPRRRQGARAGQDARQSDAGVRRRGRPPAREPPVVSRPPASVLTGSRPTTSSWAPDRRVPPSRRD